MADEKETLQAIQQSAQQTVQTIQQTLERAQAANAEPEKPSVWVKVRALSDRGFSRAGIRWTASWAYNRVTETQAKALEAEPMLVVERVDEGAVPEADKQGVIAAQEPSAEDQRVQAAQLRNAEFPLLAAAPGGEPARSLPPVLPKAPPPEPVNANESLTKAAIDNSFDNAGLPKPEGATESHTTTDAGSSTPPTVPDSSPEPVPEPSSESVLGTGDTYTSSKKRR